MIGDRISTLDAATRDYLREHFLAELERARRVGDARRVAHWQEMLARCDGPDRAQLGAATADAQQPRRAYLRVEAGGR